MPIEQPTPTHYLWLLPPPPAAARYRALIERLAAAHGTPRFEPHITLLGAVHGTPEELAARTREVARRLAPFEARLTDAGCLDEYYRALFVHVAPDPALIAARRIAAAAFGKDADIPQYMPHLSLLYGDLPATAREVLLDDIGRRFDETLSIETLALVEAGGAPESWRQVAAFTLGSV
jgi:2'-5' RNA ligase